MQRFKAIRTPLATYFKHSTDLLPQFEEEKEHMFRSIYTTIVGSIMCYGLHSSRNFTCYIIVVNKRMIVLCIVIAIAYHTFD